MNETDTTSAVENGPQGMMRRWKLLYAVSGLVALACLAVIVAIWIRVYSAPLAPIGGGETVFTTREEVDAFAQNQVVSRQVPVDSVFIPTGVVIQSLEFKGPYTIQVAGYIWTQYSDDLPAIDYGVVFPDADTTTFVKVYETHQKNETLVGWNFKTTLREQFDYLRYPLDRQRISLRIWHVDFEKDVYLIPDSDGYTTLLPQDKPGLDPNVLLENWQIDRSYFSYRFNKYNSNFGIDGYASENPQPELYYNIGIKRNILSPLVARGIAPLVILLQLFVIVTVIGSDSKRLEQFGVRPGAVIFTCAAFFFAILVAENALRDEVKWYGIVYLETVHVLTYFVILGVAANSVALVAFPSWRLFQDDNLWVEVLYWPLVMGILLVITVGIFGFG